MEIYENSESVHKLNTFWEQSKVEINNIKTDQMTFKSQDLPLARIKKIMKLDEDVKSMMISAEAPILFAKAAEFFIREITLRAWIHTERNKRRTLQRSDITLAVADGDTDQFDFLIDIVPRDEIKAHGGTKREETVSVGAHSQNTAMSHQLGGSLNLFGGNTIHLTAPAGVAANQQQQATLLSGLVDGSGGMMQAQQAGNSGLQYVLQLPSGTSLGGGQTIQIQMIQPQQQLTNIISNATSDNNNTVNTLTTAGTVLNGQQQQQMFTLSSSGVSQGGHCGTATVVLQPNMMSGGGQTQMYATATVAAVPTSSSSNNNNIDNQHQINVGVSPATTDGGGTQYVLSTVKRDMDDGPNQD